MNLGKQFKDGMLTQNPVLVQVLGMCSTMAITTSFFNGIGMGVAVTIILTLSNVIISAIRKIIPDKIRIAMFIVVIAGFVTCVDLSIQAFLPDLANSLGVFIPLIVVNCIILGRAEAFSYRTALPHLSLTAFSRASAIPGFCWPCASSVSSLAKALSAAAFSTAARASRSSPQITAWVC